MGSLRRVVRSLTAVGSRARRASSVVLVVAAVALVGLGGAPGLAGAAPSSTAALTAAAPWTWTNRGPALGAVPVAGGQGNGVSCVTVNHCVAVGDDGLVMYTDDGGLTLHWSSVPWSDSLTTLGYRLGAVTCTPASCLAVSTSAVDDTQSHVYRSTDRGATWTDTGVLPLDGITQWASAVACDQNVHCVAAGPGGGIWRSTDDGSTWSAIQPPPMPLAYFTVTCPRVDSCLAASPTETSTIVGGVVSSVVPGGKGDLTALSCGATNSCLATTSQHDVLRSDDVGEHWTNLGQTLPPALTVKELSCTTARDCVGLVDTGKRVARTLNGGETWTRSILPAPGVAGASDLACKTMRCIAVGGSALYMNSVNGGVDWLTVNYVPGMSAIDCQTSFLAGSVCVSGGMSDIGTSATDGAFWHAPIEGVAALNVFSVSCSALPSCVALTGTNVLRSVDGGDRWFAGPAPWSVTAGAPTGGTCVGALFCVAVGGSSIFTSLTGTLTWSLSTVPGGPMLGAVSCPTTALCFALDKTNGIVYRGARTVGGLGQPEWSWRATDLNLDPSTAANAIACPTATTCEIVGTAGPPCGRRRWHHVVAGYDRHGRRLGRPVLSLGDALCRRWRGEHRTRHRQSAPRGERRRGRDVDPAGPRGGQGDRHDRLPEHGVVRRGGRHRLYGTSVGSAHSTSRRANTGVPVPPSTNPRTVPV